MNSGYENNTPGFFPAGSNNKKSLLNSETKNVLVVSTIIGFALLIHLTLQIAYSSMLGEIQSLNYVYFTDSNAKMLIEMLYTIVCVCLPFFLAFIILNRVKAVDCALPFFKPKSWTEAFFLILAGVGICMVGNILTSVIVSYADNFGLGFHSYDSAQHAVQEMQNDNSGILLTIVHTALLPAFFEELTFRGFLMQPLRRYGDGYAVICAGLIFGLAHGNMMQAPFAMIVGIILGLVSIYTGSLWPSVILHFCNNLISVLQSYAISAVEGAGALFVSYIIVYGMIAVGLLGLVGFFVAKKHLPHLNGPVNRIGASKWFLFFLNPAVLFALSDIIYEIIKDVYRK